MVFGPIWRQVFVIPTWLQPGAVHSAAQLPNLISLPFGAVAFAAAQPYVCHRFCQIASTARLPGWWCHQIGQIEASARLRQIGVIARLVLIDSRQIEGFSRLPGWQRFPRWPDCLVFIIIWLVPHLAGFLLQSGWCHISPDFCCNLVDISLDLCC